MKIASILFPFLFFCTIISCNTLDPLDEITNVSDPDRMLLVLAAPSVHDNYYSDAFDEIVAFQMAYINKIIGKDNVVLIVDADTKQHYENELPRDVILVADVYDIWMRDFTTVNPMNPVQFRYTWASMTQPESEEVQGSFNDFANSFGLTRTNTNLLIDGGNIVDDYNGNVITTTRFLEDNNLTMEQGKTELRNLLGATNVAILEPDEEVLAHSDGMVSWIDENVLLVNDYSGDAGYRDSVLTELQQSFPSATILEVPVDYTTNPPGVWEGFESACGVNLNATVTHKFIYVPTFGMAHEAAALQIIRDNTSKTVVEVDARNVCPMGGSVRCLTWQLAGANADKLINAALND